MTLILGLDGKNKRYIASDRYIGDETSYTLLGRPKSIKKNSTIIMGGAGDAHAMLMIMYHVQLPDILKKEDPLLFLTQTVFPIIFDTLKNMGLIYDKVEDESEAQVDVHLLFAFKNHRNLYSMDITKNRLIDVSEHPGIAAVGCGRIEGVAALNALKDYPEMTIKEKLTKAMEITASMNNCVSAPFDIISI